MASSGFFLNGLRVVSSEHMVDGPFEDWSGVRSPGRARRRRRRYRQNIRVFYVPKRDLVQTAGGLLIGHPVAIRALRVELDAIPEVRRG